VQATNEMATARPTVLDNFMGVSLAARARLGAMASINVETAAFSAGPLDLKFGRKGRN
jgi:hypothetical protein